ncbi:hypothetical protein O9929_13380 [Vibrio lentus]|nr:hypothetical protein [Vibrio lentus]
MALGACCADSAIAPTPVQSPATPSQPVAADVNTSDIVAPVGFSFDIGERNQFCRWITPNCDARCMHTLNQHSS